jgi:hypothetical protein
MSSSGGLDSSAPVPGADAAAEAMVADAGQVADAAATYEVPDRPGADLPSGLSPDGGALDGPAALLSILANPHGDPPPVTQDFIDAFDLAWNSGCRGQYNSFQWSKLEPQPGSFVLKDLTGGVQYLGHRGFGLYLSIQMINTTSREVPSDLATESFDSAKMQGRFHALIDAIAPNLDSHVLYFGFGNEVDVYLDKHPDEWPAFQTFFEDARAYLTARAPWIKVGSTCTFDGARGAAAAGCARLAAAADVAIYTYYPLDAGFMPRPASSAGPDLAKMVELAAGKPLVLQEVGYPSSAMLGSSEQAQADFVTAVIAAWRPRAAAIPFFSYFLLHDFSPTLCDQFVKYYGASGSQSFREYLCSLGLRQTDGTAKRGWDAFLRAAASP